jgi:hypothetical protein
MKSKRKFQQEKRRNKKMVTTLSLGGVALIAVALLVYVIASASRPAQAQGEAVTVMPDSSHVPDGTDPGPYNTDPPTSGRHYNDPLEASFYEEGQVQGAYPVGHVVHNLEHGYVVFWYNCAQAGGDCTELKSQIKGVLDAEKNFKVIAFPWSSTDVPIVLTSWGRMLKMEKFDPQVAEDFVQQNRNKAPEPDAP